MSNWNIYNAPKVHHSNFSQKVCPKCGTAHLSKAGVPCPWCGHIDDGKRSRKEDDHGQRNS